MKTYATDNLPVILQNFIADYSKVYRSALIFAVNQRLAGFSKHSRSTNVMRVQSLQMQTVKSTLQKNAVAVTLNN